MKPKKRKDMEQMVYLELRNWSGNIRGSSDLPAVDMREFLKDMAKRIVEVLEEI